MININDIFNKNIKYAAYSRSGVVYHTCDLDELNELVNKGWKYNCCDKGFRVIPPSITVCDICELKKIEQYKNIILNLAYYRFLKSLIQNGKLHDYVNSITNNLFYKNFYYHISNGPILENEIKIEGSDKRVNVLKGDMLLQFLKTDYYKFYDDVKLKIKKNVFLKKVDENNNIVLSFYDDVISKNSIIKKINISKKKYDIDDDILKNVDYDLMLFMPFGCYKFINLFVNINNFKKVMFMEFHVDKDKPCSHLLFKKNMNNKKVLIIDSVYSGKTMLLAKKIVMDDGGIPILLGVYPKSKSVLNILDYALIINRIYDCKKIKNNIDFENIYIDSFRRIVYNENRKTSEI